MKNFKLSLKKEIISSLEAQNVVGGANTGTFIPNPPLTICSPDGPICDLKSVIVCPTNGCTTSCGCGETIISSPSVISDTCPF